MSLQSLLAGFVHSEIDHDQWSTHCLTATVTGQGADHSYAVTFDDKTLPDCAGLRWLGGIDLAVSKGQSVLVAIDANGSPWILGVRGILSTEPVPLGNALVSFLNMMTLTYNAHTHVCAASGSPSAIPAGAGPGAGQMTAPSGLLSSIAKVAS